MAHKDIGKMGSLENSGWQQMQVILDKEMPVQKRDRRLAYWWWMSGAAALIAAAIAFNWTTNNNNQTQPPVTAIDEIQETLTEETFANKLNSEELVLQNIPSNKSLETKNIRTQNPAIKKSLPSRTTVIKNTVSEKSGNKLKAPLSDIKNSFQNPTPIAGTLEITEKQASSIPTVIIDNSRQERESYAAMDKIDSRIDPLISLALDNNIIPSTIGVMQKDKLNLGGKAFSNNSSNPSYTELGLGIFVGIPLSRRIIFQPGIDFSIRPQFVNNQTGADFAELASQDNSGSVIQTPTQSVDPAADNNSRLNYYQISVPLKIRYRVGPMMDIAAINKVSFTHANQQSINDLVNSSFALANSSALNSQQWNIHSGVGIDYKVSEKVSIGVNYLWLLTNNYTGPNQINLDQNELEIAIMYNLN